MIRKTKITIETKHYLRRAIPLAFFILFALVILQVFSQTHTHTLHQNLTNLIDTETSEHLQIDTTQVLAEQHKGSLKIDYPRHVEGGVYQQDFGGKFSINDTSQNRQKLKEINKRDNTHKLYLTSTNGEYELVKIITSSNGIISQAHAISNGNLEEIYQTPIVAVSRKMNLLTILLGTYLATGLVTIMYLNISAPFHEVELELYRESHKNNKKEV